MKHKISLLIFVCMFCGLAANAQKITIKMASPAPSRSPWDIAQNSLVQDWARLSGGNVVLQFYNMTAQGGEIAVLQKLRSVRPGQKSPLDGAVFTSIGVFDLAPETKVLSLVVPFTFRSQEELNYILETFSPQMKAAIEAKGYMLLGWFNVGWATFYSKQEIRTPAQLKAVKMDAGGFGSSAISSSFKIAGYNTIEIPPEKFQQSTKGPNGVAASYTVPMMAYATQLHKDLPYVIDEPLCPIMSAVVISKSTWNSIPAQYRPALQDSVRKVEQDLQAAQKKTDREYLDLIGANGGTLVKLTDEEKKVFEREFRKDAETMVKIPNSVIDIDFYHEILRLLDEYRAKKQ